jgi:N-acylneuraminate cytidylyltransferase/CMP-N,N'-diacetyllegionaminic acid synthase
MLESGAAGNVITGCESRRSPYFNLVAESETGAVAPAIATARYLRRQDAPKCYDMNASIYVWWRDRFLAEPYVFDEDTRLYEMPPDRSFDIDDPLDFELVEWLMMRRQTGGLA